MLTLTIDKSISTAGRGQLVAYRLQKLAGELLDCTGVLSGVLSGILDILISAPDRLFQSRAGSRLPVAPVERVRAPGWRCSLLAVPLMVPFGGHAGNADDNLHSAEALELVSDMSSAIQTLTYSGTFVQMTNNHLETMRILHANIDGVEKERMISLNGEAREVYRDHKQVTCVWPGSQSVIVSKSKPRDIIQRVSAKLTDTGLYGFVLEDDDRVAGRPTRVVRVTPKDSYRYGYRFWIDSENSMLLRLTLLDEDEKVVEQLLFTDIQYPASIPEDQLVPAISRDSFTWTEPVAGNKAETRQDLPRRVVFEELPGGYEKVAETYEPMPIDKVPLSHVTLSDGMASISVYVEHIPQARHNPEASGISSMGAVNAYGHSTEDAFITVVGEVPADAVQMIAYAVNVIGAGESH